MRIIELERVKKSFLSSCLNYVQILGLVWNFSDPSRVVNAFGDSIVRRSWSDLSSSDYIHEAFKFTVRVHVGEQAQKKDMIQSGTLETNPDS